MPDISVKSATLSPVNKMIVGKQKDRITDYFSPARSPVMADDADSAITSTAQHGLRSHQQHPMKSARLTRTSSSDVCQLQESDVQVINDKSVDCVVLDPGYRCEACTSPTLRGNAALKTPPKSASSSTPSTPHKIQVIGNAEDLFLSPTTSNAMGRLSVCSPKQHPGVESKRTRGRKRLNMRPANAGVVVVDYTNSKMLDEASSTRSSIPDGSHDAVNSAHLGAKNWSPGSGSLNGFVRPVTRNAKMMQLQHSNDLKLNANKSTGNIIPDLINNKLDKTKGPAIDTINLTNGEDTSAKNKNAQMTDFFPIRRSERKPKATLMLERQMAIEKKILSGSEEGLRVEHFGEKGRGVVTTRMFRKGEFVVEYVGKLLDVKDAKLREQKYAMDSTMGCYMYYFVFNGVQY
ncbi:hypothetical protein HAZT_HAZT002727, partial [Hyalella azteca]